MKVSYDLGVCGILSAKVGPMFVKYTLKDSAITRASLHSLLLIINVSGGPVSPLEFNNCLIIFQVFLRSFAHEVKRSAWNLLIASVFSVLNLLRYLLNISLF